MFRIGLTFGVCATLAACSEEQAVNSNPQLPNPSAIYCIDSGGRYEIRDGENGQTGVCILPDGTEKNAWEYFRAKNQG
ncbi:putative hemolysin [Ruegeria faecimaris]|uniref:Hemolysin n=1 Tax=Ruegeria faecimaris TaxID=686389 RepID=A0A521D2H7_9RHOB|nr:DUF333 domain-containing protein [Ruegeria faecimaris]SMO65877.1 hypothetical protein SAMN06265380_104166 [Ruegeria faecimaris]